MLLYVMLWLISIVLIRVFLSNIFEKPLSEGEREAVLYVTVLGSLVSFSLFAVLWYFFDFAASHVWQ